MNRMGFSGPVSGFRGHQQVSWLGVCFSSTAQFIFISPNFSVRRVTSLFHSISPSVQIILFFSQCSTVHMTSNMQLDDIYHGALTLTSNQSQFSRVYVMACLEEERHDIYICTDAKKRYVNDLFSLATMISNSAYGLVGYHLSRLNKSLYPRSQKRITVNYIIFQVLGTRNNQFHKTKVPWGCLTPH